jgi:hypothetical protein
VSPRSDPKVLPFFSCRDLHLTVWDIYKRETTRRRWRNGMSKSEAAPRKIQRSRAVIGLKSIFLQRINQSETASKDLEGGWWSRIPSELETYIILVGEREMTPMCGSSCRSRKNGRADCQWNIEAAHQDPTPSRRRHLQLDQPVGPANGSRVCYEPQIGVMRRVELASLGAFVEIFKVVLTSKCDRLNLGEPGM